MIYKENGPNPENKSAWTLHDYIKIKTSDGSQNGAEQIESQTDGKRTTATQEPVHETEKSHGM